MNNVSKQKLVNSFNQVVTAVHNLKTDIATEGRKAFMAEKSADIQELLNILNSVTALRENIESVASIFKTYQIDLVTETHPSDFPLDNPMASENKQIEYPIRCFLNDDGTDRRVNVRMTNDSEFVLSAGSSFVIKNDRRNSRSFKQNMKKLDITVNTDTTNVIVTRDIKFTSANSLLGFVTGSRVRNGNRQLVLADNPDMTLERYLRSLLLKVNDDLK